MRTTLILDDALVDKACTLTGIREKMAIVHAGIEALIARESARRLAALGGTEPRLKAIPRRRPMRAAGGRRSRNAPLRDRGTCLWHIPKSRGGSGAHGLPAEGRQRDGCGRLQLDRVGQAMGAMHWLDRHALARQRVAEPLPVVDPECTVAASSQWSWCRGLIKSQTDCSSLLPPASPELW